MFILGEARPAIHSFTLCVYTRARPKCVYVCVWGFKSEGYEINYTS